MFYFQQNKKGENRGKQCHTKTMMRGRTNEEVKSTPNMLCLDRSRRKKYEGRGQYNEGLNGKTEGSEHLTYTGLGVNDTVQSETV